MLKSKIEKIENRLKIKENYSPQVIILRLMGKEWNDELFKSKRAEREYLNKIIELKSEEMKKLGGLPVIFISPFIEKEVRENIKKYKLKPTLYLKRKKEI